MPSTHEKIAPSPTPPSRRWVAPVARLVLLGYVALGFAAFAAVLGGCTTTQRPEESLAAEEDLTDEQNVQNVVSFPFRVAGGAVVFPLKFLFVDLPSEIAQAFEDEFDGHRKALTSDNPGERAAAVAELADRAASNPEAVALLVQGLADPLPAIRRDAVVAFAKLPVAVVREGEKKLPAPAVPIAERLRGLLGDSDPLVRAGAALALGHHGSAADIAALRRVRQKPGEDEIVQSFALLGLGKLGDTAIEAEATALLADLRRHPVAHANALMALAHLGGDTARAELTRALAHPDERAVIAAITGLGILRQFGLLMTLARDGSLLQRQKALLALGEFGGLEFVAVLERHRQSPERDIKIAATLALAQTGYPRAVPHLVELLNDRDPMTRLQALTFLIRLTKNKFGLDPTPWNEWWNSHGAEFVHARGA